MEEKKMCFIITPIGDDNTVIRRHIDGIIDQSIIPSIGEEFDIKVAHREYEIGSINDRIIQSIYKADLVIANLTGLNPNVMFELAIRYSFGKPAIVIAERGTKLPFDIIDENTIFYVNDPSGAAELRNTIRNFLGKIDLGKNNYGPVYLSIKNAAEVEKIETGLVDEDSKGAFSFLIKKLNDLEAEIKGMRINNDMCECDEHTIYNEIDKSNLAFIQSIEELNKNMSQEELEEFFQKYINNLMNRYGAKYYNVIIDSFHRLIDRHGLMSNTERKIILDILRKKLYS